MITDNVKSMKDRRTKHPINLAGNQEERRQGASSVNNLLPPNPTTWKYGIKITQPKIDATDRRQIEAINEDKAHTTKETLDDIKRVHRKEKTKKEQNELETYQIANESARWVRKTLI